MAKANGFGVQRKRQKKTKSDYIDRGVKRISDRMQLRWPGAEKPKELAWLQANFEFLSEIDIKLYRIYTDAMNRRKPGLDGKQRRKDNLIIALYESWPGVGPMLEAWARHINEFAWNATYWRGNLQQFVLNEKHNWHREWFREQTAKYTFGAERFDNEIWPLLKESKI